MGARNKYSLLVCLILIFLGCSNTPPEILLTHWEIQLVESSSGSPHEELSLFILVEDADGEDDLEFIYLIQDEEELFWEINQSNWETAVNGGENWVGKSSLKMVNGPFPRSQYRILAVDRSGRRSEQSLFISADIISEPEFPQLSINHQTLLVEGTPRVRILRIYDENDKLFNEIKTESNEIEISTMIKGREDKGPHQIYVFTEMPGGLTLRSLPMEF